MPFQNTPEKFGSLTKFLHWNIAILFVIQYFLVYRREYFPNDTNEKLQYLLLHKSLGICVLVLAFTMLLWRKVGTRPLMPGSMTHIELLAAKWTHILLYIAMFIMPLSGILMSIFAGYPVSFFGLFELPMITKSEAIGMVFYKTHVVSSYFIIAIVVVHTAAALYHHYIKKDNVLQRML